MATEGQLFDAVATKASSADEIRLAYIDALRAWAILLVLLVHAGCELDTIHKLDGYNPNISSGMTLPYWRHLRLWL